MKCKVCDVDNSEGSRFCVECGASTNNGKESERVVSAEEMKQLLWSIDWEKIRNSSEKKRLIDQIQNMMKIWKNDPSYIPIIMAPTKKDGGFMRVKMPDDDKALETFKKEWKNQSMISRMTAPLLSTINSNDTNSGGGLNNEGLRNTSIQEMQGLGINTINTTKIDTCGCVEQVFVHNHRSSIPKSCAVCLWQNPNHPDNKHTVEERLKKNYFDASHDSEPCGVCGDMRCSIKHVPPIQLQYQEAFENIQRIRRKRYERILFDMNDLMERNYPHLYNSTWETDRSTDTVMAIPRKPKPSERRGKPPNKTFSVRPADYRLGHR